MTNEKENTSLLLWSRDWAKAQRLYIIRKVAKQIELRNFIKNNKDDISTLIKLFKI